MKKTATISVLVFLCLLTACKQNSSNEKIKEEYLTSSNEYSEVIFANDETHDSVIVFNLHGQSVLESGDGVYNVLYSDEKNIFIYSYDGVKNNYTSLTEGLVFIYSQEISKSEVTIRDNKGDFISKFDLKEYMEQNAPDKLYYFDLVAFEKINDRSYIEVWTVSKIEDQNNFESEAREFETYYIDLETKVMYLKDEIMEKDNIEFHERADIAVFNDTNLLEVNNIKYRFQIYADETLNPKSYTVNIDSKRLPRENSALYSKFPELQNLREEKKNFYFIFPNIDNPITILEYFIEDGSPIIFDGVNDLETGSPFTGYEEFLKIRENE